MPTADKESEIRFMSSWVSKKLSLASPETSCKFLSILSTRGRILSGAMSTKCANQDSSWVDIKLIMSCFGSGPTLVHERTGFTMVMNKGVGVYCAGSHKTEACVMLTADKESEIRFMSSCRYPKVELGFSFPNFSDHFHQGPYTLWSNVH
ncbi:hypothetical protein RRG08_064395 [Elysia crispata]|uniref:Uncharacterized protein n=1 Tax=Elysia crispata TaxID=231223 RepID=A0AAE1ARI7_9GAST|nr:hypothetical protein RRG08_064395 [Elysia crispata]